MTTIAVLLTCFNRKEKTLSCLKSLYEVQEKYNESHPEDSKLSITLFLTDDGCTDGTSDAVNDTFVGKDIHILKGDGNLFWAGGMRLAWNSALKENNRWDYYMLLNDDTILMENVFDELMDTHSYCLNKYHQEGIYSGIICAPNNPQKITYGGDIFISKFTGSRRRLGRYNTPQMCDMTNANILLVPSQVVNKIGILYEGFKHAAADFDYTFHARGKGIPVLITSNPCGTCEFDHRTDNDRKSLLLSMSLKERKDFFNHPLHSGEDYMLLVKRTTPFKYPITLLFRKLNLYCPRLFYWLNNKR